jgi:hypothetical protein
MPLETRAVDLLAVPAPTGTAIPAEVLPYLTAAARPLAITVLVYYGIRAVILLVASTVAICTKDETRRSACLQIAQIASRGWPWLPRLPGPR